MSDPILHIKDAYYFEVPRSLWRHHYADLEEVPAFLRDGNPDVHDPHEFEEALHGKILIAQPFGELKNLHEPESGFCVSKFMILEVVVAAIIALIFIRLAVRMRGGGAPKGKLWNLFEAFLLFLRDEVVRPALASPGSL